ncbi:hypothetical protein [Neisseria polysaccharea]|uniref:hypothetical protein n=1 Tax=Neisseria polysaccharea TaxID=489 RepID=UPI00272AF530|nr:hypothetical protein [Neisseria polysaccharea]
MPSESGLSRSGHPPAQYEDLCLDLGGGKNPEPAESLFFLTAAETRLIPKQE